VANTSLCQLSLETRRHWDSFVERLERIRYSLVILNRCAKWCEDEDASSEISTAIFNVFVNLIGFWVEAVKWLRANHAGEEEELILWFKDTPNSDI
jgi:hypothetical protein